MQSDTQRGSAEANDPRWPEDYGAFLAVIVIVLVAGYASGILNGMLNVYVGIAAIAIGVPAFSDAKAEWQAWRSSRNLDTELKELSGVRN